MESRPADPQETLAQMHARARERGVNRVVYWLVRAVFQPFFHVYFRLTRIGREHVPRSGPIIFAANHRSFLDPFVIGTLTRRPIYYVAKRELFEKRWQAWFLNALGAFPVDRGHADQDTIDTARAILARGDCVVIFPEGTRVRPGSLGPAKRGVGRLVLESGAPVVPVAVIGTEAIRRGWRIRPHRVRIRCGPALRFPRVEAPSRQLAGAVTERIWPCVMLQWEWLGGLPPLRRAAVLGASPQGVAVAAMLAQAGLEVELGCRSDEQADALASTLPDGVRAQRGVDVALAAQDLVVLAQPARALPAAVAAHGGSIPARAGVLVLARGLVPPLGALPTAYVAERVRARAVACLAGPVQTLDGLDHGAALMLASADAAFARQLGDVLDRGGYDVQRTADVVGAELAGCATDVAALAAGIAAGAGPAVAGMAAGKVFAELGPYVRRCGGGADALAGLAGTGGLVASVLAGARPDAPAALLPPGPGGAGARVALGPDEDAIDSVPLLSGALRAAGIAAPTVEGLSALLDGDLDPARWTAAVTAPDRGTRRARAA